MQVSIWHPNTALHLQHIWMQTLAEINSESCQRKFSKLLRATMMAPSKVAVLFYWNLRWRPFLGQVANSDLVL